MFCDKVLSRCDHLTTHKLNHTGENPFQCMFYEKVFKESAHLTTHKLSHTGGNLSNVCSVKSYLVDLLI